MASITAEITFMVYSQNGVGRIEKRTMELSNQDFSACTSSLRDKNEQLIQWAFTLFPTARKVHIQGARKIEIKKEPNKKRIVSKESSPNQSIFRTPIWLIPFRIIGAFFKLLWRIFMWL